MRELNSHSSLILLAILLVFLSTFSCGKKKQEKVHAAKKEVSLYTSVPVKIIESIKLEFERENPGIELEVFRSGTAETMSRIREEAEAGVVRADVVWVADFSAAEELKEKELLQKYISPEAENIIPIFIDGEGYYAGSRLLNIVVAYNKRFIEEEPHCGQLEN